MPESPLVLSVLSTSGPVVTDRGGPVVTDRGGNVPVPTLGFRERPTLTFYGTLNAFSHRNNVLNKLLSAFHM